MADVFISYKADDRARVRPLVEALQADGLSVWWDAHIGGGDDWRESIAANLEQARCVIVIWSKRSVGPDGRFVRDEAGRATKRGVYLPVVIDKVDPPLGFGETQCLPLAGWKGNREDPRYLAVFDAARRSVAGGQHTPRAASAIFARSTSRRALLAGGAVAVVAATVATGWLVLRPGPSKAKSVAVLPFDNLSGDPAQAYFSDGIAEEIRGALGRIPGLKVVARTSSELVRNVDATTAAKKLSVANILAGSVRRSPSTIRVAAQLVDGTTGIEVWSQTFDRPAGDVLQIQTDIAQNVAEALKVQFGGATAIGGTASPAAQDLVLKANAVSTSQSGPDIREAVDLLNSAIAIDPYYAEAYARRSLFVSFIGGNFARNGAEVNALQERAEIDARRAIALAPQLSVGHAALGGALRNELNMSAALKELERAAALPGARADTFGIYGTILAQIGRFDEASKWIAKAAALDPLNPRNPQSQIALLNQSRHYIEAARLAQAQVAIRPDHLPFRAQLGFSQLLLGQTDAAARTFATLPPSNVRRLTGEAIIAGRARDLARSDRLIEALRAQVGDAGSYQYAQIYAQRGQTDRAFAALNIAFLTRDAGLPGILTDPFVDPIRRDPRFTSIVAKMRFPAK